MFRTYHGNDPSAMGSIYHKGKYVVIVKKNIEETRKDIVISIEKLFESDCLRITLSDESEPAFLCLLNVNRSDYDELKKQQGLLIDFDNFPEQLVRLLKQCSINKMFLILQQSNPLQYYFEIVEHNEFKRLIHLSLKTSPATDEDVKRHMADYIATLKKTIALAQTNNITSESAWQEKYAALENKLEETIKSKHVLEDDKQRRETEFQDMIRRERDRLAQERIHLQKSTDDTIKMETANFKDVISKKDRMIDDFNNRLHQYQESKRNLEGQINDKTQRISILEQEVQSSHIEVATLKAKNTVLERDLSEKEANERMMKNKLNDTERHLRELMEQAREMNATINSLKYEKNQLEERLKVSESLANKNNNAMQSTSEQLVKANQIISKQHSDLVEMKEKVLCRTHIALEQEKVIEKHEKDIESLQEINKDMKEKIDKLNGEVDTLKCKCEESERLLKEKDETIRSNNEVLQWLHKKVESLEYSPRTSEQMRKHSTPHESRVTPHSSRDYEDNYHQDLTGETVNFYETSRRSNLSDTPVSGLDPKYLRPATDDEDSGKPTSRRTGTTTSSRDKENKCTNLPAVDFRDKKSGKTVSYRRTPVSAYFPKP